MVLRDGKATDQEDTLIAQAAAWLARLDSGTATLEEFNAWRDADPKRAVAFVQVAAAWQKVGTLRAHPAGQSRAAAPAPRENPLDRPKLARRGFFKTAFAAGLATVAAGAGGLLLHDPRESVATAVGERRTVRLPDDSTIELNTDTLIAWDFSERRNLWLERGEAALAIAADAVRPFVLHVGMFEAELSQGHYNARLRNTGVQLVALSGHGQVTGGRGSKVDLAPMLAVEQTPVGIATDPVSQNEAQAVSAWRRGEIIFQGTRLDAAVAEFNRYLTRKFAIADPSMRSVRLGGRFHVDDPHGFLRALEQGFNIRARVTDSTIWLASRA